MIDKIDLLDNQIQSTIQAIVQAQLVKVRSLFTKETNMFSGFQQKLIESRAENSVQWHQKQLYLLYIERKSLQKLLNTLTGKTWVNRINNFFRIFSLIAIIIASFLLLVTGLLATLYLLPIAIIIVIFFMALRKLEI